MSFLAFLGLQVYIQILLILSRVVEIFLQSPTVRQLLWWVWKQAVKYVVKRILRRCFGQLHWALEAAIVWAATKLIQLAALAIISTVIQLG